MTTESKRELLEARLLEINSAREEVEAAKKMSLADHRTCTRLLSRARDKIATALANLDMLAELDLDAILTPAVQNLIAAPLAGLA